MLTVWGACGIFLKGSKVGVEVLGWKKEEFWLLVSESSNSGDCFSLPSPPLLNDFSLFTLECGAGKCALSCDDCLDCEAEDPLLESLLFSLPPDNLSRWCFADGVAARREDDESVLEMGVSLLPPQLTSISRRC